MENVVYLQKPHINIPKENEWEAIGDIFSRAIKRKNLSASQINDMATKIKSEVRGE